MEDAQVLVKGLSDIHRYLQAKLSVAEASTETKIERLKQPQTSVFLTLPDSILMLVFTYLDFISDVSIALEICHKFNRLLRSTQFQFILYTKPAARMVHPRSRSTTVPAESTPDSDLFLTRAEEDQLSKEEASKRLQKANKIKEVLAGKIIKQEKMIESLSQELERINKEILTEKQNSSKNLGRVAELEREYEKYKADIETNQVKLKNMHQKHAIEVETLQGQINKLQADSKELEEHKRMLRCEVLRLREEGASLNKEIDTYRSALNKMKKYFDAMFSNEIKKQS